MITMTWKVYGRAGHRQKVSFSPSFFTQDGIEVINSDRTGTNAYTIIRITRRTQAECRDVFESQLSDGVFENAVVGMIQLVYMERRGII